LSDRTFHGYYTTNLFKNPSFTGEQFIKTKALQLKPKGWKLSGSPRRSIGRTFRIVFKLPNPKGKLKIVRRE